MKLRIVSDLHVEFHADKGAAILDEVVSGGEDYDVLVLAGDISDFEHLPSTCERITKLVDGAKKPCLYVVGNHEAYGGTIADAIATVGSFDGLYMDGIGIAILENNFFHWNRGEKQGETISRFLGTTLWYSHALNSPFDANMGDFNYINHFKNKVGSDIHQRAMAAKSFLFDSVKVDDIVITHFLPHPKSILPQWQNSALNGYFLHDVSPVVAGRSARLWIHGHTHGSLDYVVGTPGSAGTRVVCNPLGYARGMAGEPNPKFNPTLTIEV